MKVIDYIAALIIFPAIYVGFISIMQIGDGFTAISSAAPAESHSVASTLVDQIINSQSFLVLFLVPSMLLCSYVSLKLKHSEPLYKWSLILSSFVLLISLPILTVVGIYTLWLSFKGKSKT